MRIYVVTEGSTERLVEAESVARVIRFVAEPKFSVSPAKAADVARLMKAGVQVEVAKGE